MAIHRVLLLAGALALVSFAVFLPINLAWSRPLEMASYGASYGAIGVVYGFCVARFWLRVQDRPADAGEAGR